MCAGRLDERRIELPQPVEQDLTGLAAHRSCLRAERVQLAHDRIDDRIQRPILPAAQRRQPRDDALEMRGKAAGGRPPADLQSAPRLVHPPLEIRAARDAHGAAPFVEDVEHVRFAELDATGRRRGPLA